MERLTFKIVRWSCSKVCDAGHLGSVEDLPSTGYGACTIASMFLSRPVTAPDRETTIKCSDLPAAVEEPVAAEIQGATIRGFFLITSLSRKAGENGLSGVAESANSNCNQSSRCGGRDREHGALPGTYSFLIAGMVSRTLQFWCLG